MISGAIDLGGTKIEARLFDGMMQTVAVKRVSTPREDFASFLAALVEQIRWLEATGENASLPIAISIAGLIDPKTGIATASNIPVSGHNLGLALRESLGRGLPMVNDCMAFAYSEAHGGAAEGADSVLGLVLGTGVGAGFVIEGRIPPRHAGLAVEIGHLGMPARALERHRLPIWTCGCGRIACNENYTSGTGLRRIAEWAGLADPEPQSVASRASADAESARVMQIWADLTGEMIYSAQLMLDPQVIVLGGGLSNIPRLPEMLSEAIGKLRLGQVRLPDIRVALHGDSSGARGAALMAKAGMA
ncbi:ROK family protein [Paracoccus sp. MBLB3053]|uniref:ROK family protein n=1 Tax=Paracoccus aurantius TaxID=3073814 RepID=A0ABU2HVP2_9RHOB|nr:ROK family protein [Paracoccus sp. MBLB3053]MDS9469121.1 ROK family protein [Paracoccus sp. MBLB3053]